ncbi:hypothetical protein BT63DRAFT_478723 [Microthyrium microscopicum]|uniref:Uncharacterized protein n=1 Tax=Microthyrium microscopicum TaxID=703497 RepID=A0A6A6UG25_9PEZI|nr:hypothetical protein BT63DRAFT_478723 [Microthyrium microscopicum]
MRGKNRRKPKGVKIIPGSWINGSSNDITSTSGQQELAIPSPRREFGGSGLSLCVFAQEMQPYSLELIFNFFTILKHALYPLEVCVDATSTSTVWFDYLRYDTTYTHSVLWSTEAYFNLQRQQPTSEACLFHMSKTLTELQILIAASSDVATRDTTISVVVNLIMSLALLGNIEQAEKHMIGLHHLITLRGGLRALQSNIQLQMKASRADLMIALAINKTPTLLSATSISWVSYLAPPNTPITTVLAQNPELAAIYADLVAFARLANIALQTGTKINPLLFQEILISSMYRLLLLPRTTASTNQPNASACDQTPIVRALHTSLTATAANVFLQTGAIGMRFATLSAHQRRDICALDESAIDEEKEMRIWMLVIARITAVDDSDDEWIMSRLSALLRSVKKSEWKEIRTMLKSFIWMDLVHDGPGQECTKAALAWTDDTDEKQTLAIR